MSEKKCILGVQRGQEIRAAFEVCIKNENVYVNYFDPDGNKGAHKSYHASGQQHIKENGHYAEWGGFSGSWEPMKWFTERPQDVVGRQDVSFCFLRWNLLPTMLADKIFEAPEETEFPEVGFKTTLVGPDARDRKDILGFPVLGRHRISSNDLSVEVEMFGINSELAEKPYSDSNS